MRILKNIVPDLIFIDLNTADGNTNGFLRNIINVHSAYVILYSPSPGNNITKTTHPSITGCIHLPANIQTAALLLQELLTSQAITLHFAIVQRLSFLPVSFVQEFYPAC